MKVTFSYIAPHIEVTAPVMRAGVSYAAMKADVNYALMTADVSTNSKKLNYDFVDAINATDQAHINFIKSLSDSITATDGTPILSTTKALADIIAATESISMSTTKPLADSIAAADAGLVHITDYADISYFAEDYVGTSRTF